MIGMKAGLVGIIMIFKVYIFGRKRVGGSTGVPLAGVAWLARQCRY